MPPPFVAPTALLGAVLPAVPAEYDAAYMARVVYVINMIIDQLSKPQQVTAATLVCTNLPHETPRQNIEGEVFTKVCTGCGATVLAIEQTLPEVVSQKRSK